MMELFKKYLLNLSKNEKMYVVGGAVRDYLIGKPFNDLDLVVEKNAEEIAKRLAESLGCTFVELSREFGTYRVVNEETVIDISLQQGRTIEEDLKQRDFTINAMAIPVQSLFEERIYLIDPFFFQLHTVN